tara:strand:- start:28 stop:603 length:576 start_codon:yes stop_codon:yes gene_type:complete
MHNRYFKKELYRKYIHISSLLIPFLIWYFGKQSALPFLVILSIALPLLDYSRRHSKYIKLFYLKLFEFVTRKNEFQNLTGASWIFISASLTTIIFKENIAIVSLIILSISDSFASIVGIKYGVTKFFSKTLEGSIAFFISTNLILITLTALTLVKVIFFSITITLIELFSKKINDNLAVPITAAIVLSLFN